MTTQETQTPPIPPIFVLSLGILAISVSAILVRFAQTEDVPSLVIATWRMIIASVVVAPFCFTRQREEVLGLGSAEIRAALIAGISLAIHFVTWISSLNYTSVASSTVLVTTAPLWVALISPFILKEKTSRPVKIGIGLTLFGSLIIGLSGWSAGGQSLWGNFLALSGAWCVTVYYVIGRKLRASLSLLTYITLVYGFSAIVLLIITLGAGYSLFDYTPTTYLLFLLMALIPQLLGHTSFNWALAYLPASFVTVTIVSEPIGATLLALLIFQEIPTLYTLIGGVLIIIGIITASKS